MRTRKAMTSLCLLPRWAFALPYVKCAQHRLWNTERHCEHTECALFRVWLALHCETSKFS